MRLGTVNNLFLGTPAKVTSALDGAVFDSSIARKPVHELTVTREGIAGDQCHSLKVHGGPDRVIHQMSGRAYALWRQNFPHHAAKLSAGAIGENIFSNEDMHEGTVCIGDVLSIGSVLVQVTEPRRPCTNTDDKLGIKGLCRFMVNSAVTGWMYRILEPGVIYVDDSIFLMQRPHPNITVETAFVALVRDKDRTLAAQWRDTVPEFSERWKNELLR